jgi:glutamate racemase
MFDSGFGGLTVLKEVQKALPDEKIFYFGDTARLPYGEKSPEAIVKYSLDVVRFLAEKEVKALVIACNTACAHAFKHIQAACNIPVIGVIQPGAEKAAQTSKNKRIGVLATKGTVLSGEYAKAIQTLLPEASIFSKACPLLVPLVEEHFHEHPAARMIVEEYLREFLGHRIDTLLLGCTHYPILKPLIREVAGPDIAIVDSATTCAEKLIETLDARNLRAQGDYAGAHRFFVSDDPDKFRKQGPIFLGKPIEQIELV